MKQKKIGDILYVFSTTAYEITEDTDAEVIKIQLECIPAYEALNASLKDKFEPINYKLFCVKHPEWADYYDDYSVTISSITGGTVTASPNSGDEGEEITLSQEASSGYEFVSWDVEDASGNEIEVTDNKFLMPASNVTVGATFDMIDFAITVDDNIENGTLSAPASANLGDTITITATPATGYVLNTLTVMCGSLELTVVNNQFTMPAGDVTITGTFIDQYMVEYFTIESEVDNNAIAWKYNNASGAQTIQYSTDMINWNSKKSTEAGIVLTILMAGEKIYIKGNISYEYSGTYSYFASQGDFKVYGNSMSLIYGDNFTDKTTISNYALYGLFNGCATVTDASNLMLPATTATERCYREMFKGCTSLTTAPKTLPATIVEKQGYYRMFSGCESLTTAPSIQAIEMRTSSGDAENCYEMFAGCESLTTVPDLNTTTLATSSCYSMFKNCTSLTTAPLLPATTLANECYRYMFDGCTSLTSAPALNATTLVSGCYRGMFRGCTSLTAAPALNATTLAGSCCYDMFSGCTALTTAPVLPATTLPSCCYYQMFYGCTSLNSITMLATTLAGDSLYNWVKNVSASGTFTKDANMTTLPEGNNGIPAGWTVQDYTPSV